MLRVIQPFGGRSAGETISDADEIAEILASDHALYVVNVSEDAAPKNSRAGDSASKE